MKQRRSILLLLILAIAATAMFTACQPKSFTLSFETYGGTVIAPITAAEGEDISGKLPSPPEKSGSVFAGWYDNAGFNGNAVELPSVMPGKNITYYAKWSESTASLTLDAVETELEKDTFDIPVNAVIYDYIKDIKPVVEGLVFDKWYYSDGRALGVKDVMPSTGTTLIAKYNAKVILNVYKRKLGDEGFDGPETKNLFEQYKATVNIEDILGEEHFHLREGDSRTLTINKGDNVLDVYLERNSYTVSFRENLPADSTEFEGEVDEIEALYEEEIKLPENTFYVFPYMFAVWGTQSDGGTFYHSGNDFKVEGNTEFFAIWDKGYIDRFGGIDILYVLAIGDPGKVILSRPGLPDIEGTVNDNNIFTVTKDDITLTGRISPDGRFVYYRETQKKSYNLYDPYENKIVRNESLELDGYDGATFTDTDGKVYKGTYAADYDVETGEQTGTYLFISQNEDGELQGFYFAIQQVNLNADDEVTDVEDEIVNRETVFLRQSSQYGTFYRFVLKGAEGKDSQLYPTLAILDGFGSMIIGGLDSDGEFDISAMGTYREIESTNIIEANLSLDGKTYNIYYYKLLEVSGLPVYIEYNEEVQGRYTNGNDVLELDGYGASSDSATYTTASGTKTGMYVYELFSDSGNKIVRFTSGDETLTFRLDGDKFTYVGGRDYNEYYRFTRKEGETSTYQATMPYIILDGIDKISLYIPNAVNRLVLIAEGSYSVDSQDTYTANMRFVDAEYSEYASYLNMKFNVSEETFSNGTDDVVLKIYTVVKDKQVYRGEGETTLTLDDYGNGEYDDGTYIYSGKYFRSERDEIENVFELAVFEDGEFLRYFFFKLNDADMTFELLGNEVGAYTLSEGGTLSELYEVLFLNGEGRAILYEIPESGEMQIKCRGAYTLDVNEQFGHFVSDDVEEDNIEFDFALLVLDDTDVFTKFSENFSGDFVHGNDILNLDGYEYGANYMKDGEDRVFGNYYIRDSLVYFIVTDTNGNVLDVKYFELGENKTFEERSYEWGEYAGWTLGGGLTYEILKLDGHGKAELWITINTDEGLTEEKSAEGTYICLDPSTAEFEFDLEDITDQKAVKFVARLARYDSEPIFIKYDDKQNSYVNGINVFSVDGYGNASYVDDYGILHYGIYNLLGETLIEFTPDDMDEMFIRLNTANRAFTPITDGFISEGNILYKYLGNDDKVVIPEEITEIAALAFTTLYNGRYTGKDIKRVDLNNVEIIGNEVFRGCYELTALIGGKKVTEIGNGAFQSCIELASLGDMTELVRIGDLAFYGCDSIEKVKFDKVAIIEAGAFSSMWGLQTAEFAGAKTVESMAFYDCPELTEVKFGSLLEEIQNEAFEADSYVSGNLTVVIEAENPVKIGLAVFNLRQEYIIKLKDLDTVFEFAEAEGWSAYAAHLTHKDENNGTYYSVSMERVVLNGILYIAGEAYGVYDLNDGDNGVKNITVYRNASRTVYYTGTISDDKGLTLVYAGSESRYPLLAGKEYELTDTESGKILVLTMKSDAEWTGENAIDAVFDERGNLGSENKNTIKVEYNGEMLYMIDNGYRKQIVIDFDDKTFAFGEIAFIEVTEQYTCTDGSWIYLTYRDAEQTSYYLEGGQLAIRTSAGSYLLVYPKNIDVKVVSASVKSFTFNEINGEANYVITIEFDTSNKKFTYTYKALEKVTLDNNDKRVVLWLDDDGNVFDIEFHSYDSYNAYYRQMEFVGWKKSGDAYVITILDRGYEAEYTVSINPLMTECTITQTALGGRAWVDGVARVAVLLKNNVPEFHLFLVVNGREAEVPTSDLKVEQSGDKYTLTVNGQRFFVSYTSSNNRIDVKLIVESNVYTSQDGTFTLKKNENGELVEVVLEIASLQKRLTGGESHSDAYGRTHYRFTEDDKVYDVEPDNSDLSFVLTIYNIKTVSIDSAQVKFTATEDGRFDEIISFSENGQDKSVKTKLIGYDVLITCGDNYYFLTMGAEPALSTTEKKTAQTSDGTYRVTVIVCKGKVVDAIKFESKENNSFAEKAIAESYFNEDGDLILKVSGFEDRLHCTFKVTDGNVSVEITFDK